MTKDQIPSDVLRQVADELGHYVYALVDPNNGIPFYIGKGTGDRFAAHGREALWTYDGGDLETEVDEQALAGRGIVLNVPLCWCVLFLPLLVLI